MRVRLRPGPRLRLPAARGAARLTAHLALALLAASCTFHKLYRPQDRPPPPPPFVRPLGARVEVCIIELDDHGEFWSRTQLAHTLGEIDFWQNQDRRGAIVVTFVHGWENNASSSNEDSGNLHDFEGILVKLAAQESASAAPQPPRPIVGVYLAWRGEAIHPIPLIQPIFTFFSRYAAAGRVGDGTAATESLFAIMAKTRDNPRSKSVLVGHSFGGLIVEKALSQVIADWAIRAVFAKPSERGHPVEPVVFTADLMVLVNPAAPALYAKRLIGALQYWHFTPKDKVNPDYVCDGATDWRPLIVSITSVGDDDTGFFFPLGTNLGYALERYRSYGVHTPDDPPIEGVKQGQRYFFTHTEGHVEDLFSHTLDQRRGDGCREGAICPCSADVCADKPTRKVCYNSGPSQFLISRRAAALNDTPYWIMQAPVSLIKNHTAIFVPGFVDMLSGLVEVTDIIPPQAHRARLAPPE
jgi:hypothetical protein